MMEITPDLKFNIQVDKKVRFDLRSNLSYGETYSAKIEVIGIEDPDCHGHTLLRLDLKPKTTDKELEREISDITASLRKLCEEMKKKGLALIKKGYETEVGEL